TQNYINGITGMEVDVVSIAGTQQLNRVGIDIALAGPVGGTTNDFGLYFSAVTGSLGWNKAIWFDLGGGAAPIRPSGTLLGTGGSWSITNGIDISSLTVSGDTLKAPGLHLDGSGKGVFGSSTVAADTNLVVMGNTAATVAPPAGMFFHIV